MFCNFEGILYCINEYYQFVKYSSKYIVYDIYGRKDIECTFKDGLLDGELIKYYPDTDTDKIWAKFNYMNGKREGLQYRYYKNGAILTESVYCSGIRHGYYKMFSEYGHCIESKLYQFNTYYQ